MRVHYYVTRWQIKTRDLHISLSAIYYNMVWNITAAIPISLTHYMRVVQNLPYSIGRP